MSPEQALQYLAQVTASLQANRETHLAIINAIKVIEDALKPKQ